MYRERCGAALMPQLSGKSKFVCPDTFAEALKTIIKHRGYSYRKMVELSQLGEKHAELVKTTIGRWVNGELPSHKMYIDELVRVLECSDLQEECLRKRWQDTVIAEVLANLGLTYDDI
jgi:hypothetical protein